MRVFIIAISLCLLAITPASAKALPIQAHDRDQPKGTVNGALACIARYQKSKKLQSKFKYYPSWNAAEKDLNEMAYAYEGMILDQRAAGDFMKNHEIIIIRHRAHNVRGYLHVTEEVIYPVWSNRNHAHVLRGVIIRRTFRSATNAKFYRSVDGAVRRL